MSKHPLGSKAARKKARRNKEVMESLPALPGQMELFPAPPGRYVILLADAKRAGAPMRGVSAAFPGRKTTEYPDLMKRFPTEEDAGMFLARSWTDTEKWRPIVTLADEEST